MEQGIQLDMAITELLRQTARQHGLAGT